MDKNKILEDIFNNDPLGLLDFKPKVSSVLTADERLLSSFKEINNFVETTGKEPKANTSNVSEFQLYSRLKNLKEDKTKIKLLKEHDIHHLLPAIKPGQVNDTPADYEATKEINSIDDLLNNDLLDLLGGDDEGLFDFKHTPKEYERAQTDFVARRKPCKDFHMYEQMLMDVQKDLSIGNRRLVEFNQNNLVAGAFYVHNGVLFYLESINIDKKEHYREDGTRVREDGRTRCIFENGTESRMYKRSVEKILYANGRVVTDNITKINEEFIEKFSDITEEDKEDGYIYVLKSMSKDEKIQSVKNLYKIGYSRIDVQERVKNAEKEPTYLMAPVYIEGAWKCYNMNSQKMEQLLHNFFGNSCLEIDVFDKRGKRHSPREWFIAPIEVIEQAIELLINGKIVKYKFDAENLAIVRR